MVRAELDYTDEQIKAFVYQGYQIKTNKLIFIDSGSFFGFILENDLEQKLFLKIYPHSHWLAYPNPPSNSLNQVGFALKTLREEYHLQNLSQCIATKDNQFCYEVEGLWLVVFDHIEGFHPPYSPNQLASDRLAKIFYQLHQVPADNFSQFEKENFDIQYAQQLVQWFDYEGSAEKILSFLKERRELILRALEHLNKEQRAIKQKNYPLVLTHGDAHHFNVLQTESELWLIDWDGLKIAPVERDLWHYEHSPLIEFYTQLNPTYHLDRQLCAFYHWQRFLEDIHYWLGQIILKKNTTAAQDEKDREMFLNHWGWHTLSQWSLSGRI